MQKLTVNFLPNKLYPEIKNIYREVGNSLGHDLSIKNGKNSCTNVGRTIKGLGPCVGLAVITPKQNFYAHCAPEIDIDPQSVSNYLSRVVYNIKNENKLKDEDVAALVYGGIAYDEDNNLSSDSIALVDGIVDGLKAESVEPAIITGQFSDGLSDRIDSYMRKDHVTVWGKLIDKMGLTPNASQAQIQKVLEEFFEYVNIPQNTILKVIHDVPNRIKAISEQKKL